MSDTFWLFLALGWGFAFITALMSWWRVCHGLTEVLDARRDRKRYEKCVETLTKRKAALERGAWETIYSRLRNAALQNIADGKGLMRAYERGVRLHSRHGGTIDMQFPELILPPELESPEPPPLPDIRSTDNNAEETRR